MVDILVPILAVSFGVAVVVLMLWYGLFTPLPFSRKRPVPNPTMHESPSDSSARS